MDKNPNRINIEEYLICDRISPEEREKRVGNIEKILQQKEKYYLKIEKDSIQKLEEIRSKLKYPEMKMDFLAMPHPTELLKPRFEIYDAKSQWMNIASYPGKKRKFGFGAELPEKWMRFMAASILRVNYDKLEGCEIEGYYLSVPSMLVEENTAKKIEESAREKGTQLEFMVSSGINGIIPQKTTERIKDATSNGIHPGYIICEAKSVQEEQKKEENRDMIYIVDHFGKFLFVDKFKLLSVEDCVSGETKEEGKLKEKKETLSNF